AGLGLVGGTVETSITWERWPEFDAKVRAAVNGVLREVCGGGTVNCRFTHVYPDGPAPYYTYAGAYRVGAYAEQQAAIKKAASDAIMAAGGTITHHHAVGKLHRPWYDGERPELFATALRATKKALDPNGILNPGVLIDV
ncbi:MAG TPA: FAD-binding oxidoreductase, partial [Dehalococcoidia bacterium]|nr:FAD-binding oxidoreductase [Dehalococcoidia bacterium]